MTIDFGDDESVDVPGVGPVVGNEFASVSVRISTSTEIRPGFGWRISAAVACATSTRWNWKPSSGCRRSASLRCSTRPTAVGVARQRHDRFLATVTVTATADIDARRDALRRRFPVWRPRTLSDWLDDSAERYGERPMVLTDDACPQLRRRRGRIPPIWQTVWWPWASNRAIAWR